jgi:hypothetical protein
MTKGEQKGQARKQRTKTPAKRTGIIAGNNKKKKNKKDRRNRWA